MCLPPEAWDLANRAGYGEVKRRNEDIGVTVMDGVQQGPKPRYLAKYPELKTLLQYPADMPCILQIHSLVWEMFEASQ